MLHAAQRTWENVKNGFSCNNLHNTMTSLMVIYLGAQAAKGLDENCSLSIDVGAPNYPGLLQWLVFLRLVPGNKGYRKVITFEKFPFSTTFNGNLSAMIPGISCSAISISLRPYT